MSLSFLQNVKALFITNLVEFIELQPWDVFNSASRSISSNFEQRSDGSVFLSRGVRELFVTEVSHILNSSKKLEIL